MLAGTNADIGLVNLPNSQVEMVRSLLFIVAFMYPTMRLEINRIDRHYNQKMLTVTSFLWLWFDVALIEICFYREGEKIFLTSSACIACIISVLIHTFGNNFTYKI